MPARHRKRQPRPRFHPWRSSTITNRPLSLVALAALCAACAAAAPAQALAQATPPPAQAIQPETRPTATPALHPTGSPTPAPPTESETDKNRVGITGVWEVQIQPDGGHTIYTHFKLNQTGTALTGEYLDANGKHFPLAGSVDGKNVRIVVSKPDGTAVTFTATVDGTTDMLGMMQTPKRQIVFTAAYRPKYKWLDNIAPGTGTGP